jgi:hypothetical protein
MKIKLTESQYKMLLEIHERIFHGGSDHSKFKSLIRQGYSPYVVINGNLLPHEKTLERKMQTSNPPVVYFLTDEEYQKAKTFNDSVNRIRDLKMQEIGLYNQMTASYIVHNILGHGDDNPETIKEGFDTRNPTWDIIYTDFLKNYGRSSNANDFTNYLKQNFYPPTKK